MKTKDKIIFSLLFIGSVSFLAYQIREVLSPFILAIIISYLLNPAVNVLNKKLNLPRFYATTLILVIFIILFGIFCLLVFPLLYNQALILAKSMPHYIDYCSHNFYPKIVLFFADFDIEIEHNLFELIKNSHLLSIDYNFIKNLVAKIIGSTNFIINLISLIFIMPVLVFYLLTDWNDIVKKIDDFLPKKYYTQIKEIFYLIDKSISGFIRGQTNVCLVLSTYYATLLGILGLENGIFIGFLTGVVSFLPYVGYAVSFTIAVIVALFQWGVSYIEIGGVVIVYLIGQVVESNFLVPHLVGKQVQLHPLWIIFGIFFFGALFGFTGVLLSVPLSAIFATLLRYFLKNYYNKS